MPEKFEPRDYESYEDLPEEEKSNFKKVEGGFVGKDALDLEEAQEESIKTFGCKETGNNNKENQDLDRERQLAGYIKDLIMEKKVCLHSPSGLLSSILEKGVENSDLEIKRLKSIFDNGIWSSLKMLSDRVHGRKRVVEGRGFDPKMQWRSKEKGEKILKAMINYIESKKDIENLNYDSILSDESFLKFLSDEFKSEINIDDLKDLLDSRATRSAFTRLKQKDWEKRRRNYGRKYALDLMARVYFGENFISTYPPNNLKKYFEETGNVRDPIFDKLGVIVTIKGLRTLPLMGDDIDLGVANKIPVKNFVAVVIRKEVEDLPEEVLEIIPENIPIITTDFRVIRMPEEKIITNFENS